VGGFAESPLLQEEVRGQFNSTLKVVIPQVRSVLHNFPFVFIIVILKLFFLLP